MPVGSCDDRHLHPRHLAGALLVAFALTGCGVQADADGRAEACTELEPFLGIKDDADRLDREMLNLRPSEVTPETVKALAPRYRDASEQYDQLRQRAEAELARARSADPGLTNVWELTVESMTIRRDGFTFYAKTFANPESLRRASVQEESDEWGRKTLEINASVQESSSQWMRDHGFEETADGNFIINC